MIVRIVKMTFQKERIQEFVEVFASAQHKIASFDGCNGVELMRDTFHTNIFFTISLWNDLDALEQYRNSELFNITWAKTKILFAGKPEAWSVEKIL
ncbi:MAG: antibiotic biosynthesis monooxygenase [Fimbriimonadaceae bacterium]|nr:antibiotic biosynthesis monooxygenase [Chitinophagales bacterium]